MSLYREAGRGSTRTLVIAAVVALLIGGGIGYAIGRSSAPEPSAAELGAKLRSELRPVRGGLALIPNEYAQAYKGQGAEAEGVTGALDRIERQLIAAAPDLRALDPKGVEQLDIAFDKLRRAVVQKAPPAEVKQLAENTSEVLAGLPGGS
jgi:hypothetical protein